MKRLPTNQKGQALLIVLLTMAVILTVVLSVVSRSVTDITTTTYEEDALRAFNAAEAGVEEALLQGTVGDPAPVTLEPNVSYDVEVTAPQDEDKRFRYPKDLVSGEVANFWLVSHDINGKLVCGGQPCFRSNILGICWGNPTASVVPAVEIMVYYDTTRYAVTSGNFSNVRVKKFAFDPLARGNFSPPNVGGGCDFSGDIFKYRAQININNDIDSSCDEAPDGCPLMAKVRMLYATAVEPQKIGVWISGSISNLPAQGLQILSEGVAGESKRRINVFQNYPDPPDIFDAAVFSMQDLVKNVP